MNNEITERWEKTRLLDELDDFSKNECAVSLQEAADLLVGEMNEYMKEVDKAIGRDGYFAGSILPIVRRLYGEDEEGCPEKMPSLSLKWLFEDFGEYIKGNVQLFNDLNTHIALDAESEIILGYMRDLKNRM